MTTMTTIRDVAGRFFAQFDKGSINLPIHAEELCILMYFHTLKTQVVDLFFINGINNSSQFLLFSKAFYFVY